MELGDAALGSIQAGADQQARREELMRRIASGEFHRVIEWVGPGKMIIARCVDGRSPDKEVPMFLPNAAGGTESLFVADDLTTKRYAADDASTLSGYQHLLEGLAKEGYSIGGHTDTHADGDKSGCGANDKLAVIYDYIKKHAGDLQVVAAKLGVIISDADRDSIAANASTRTQFSEGRELLDALKTAGGIVDVLVGEHKEVVAVINTRQNTTLDRNVLADEFGNNYQAFNVDVWAFEDAARAISLEAAEVRQKVAAMVFYNLATTMVLAGPKMRVIVL